MSDYRTIAFDSWGRKCGLCNNTVGLEAHHISGDHSDDRAENLMPLCGTCHNLVTSNLVDIDGTTRQPIILVAGVFERGPSTPAPPPSVELGVTALQQLVEIWELRDRRPLLLLQDGVSGAFYVECHVPAAQLIERLDFDTLIDPPTEDEDPELEQYRFNRRLNESSDVFQRLVQDAENGRPFADLILEWSTEYNAEAPLKVLGGQHRGEAIKRAVTKGVERDRLHGVRVYLGLSMAQRVELVIVANSNIVIPNPLLDRIAEHQLGGASRSWCQKVGLLGPGQDFTDRVANENRMTVQVMRAFVTNYIHGMEFQGSVDEDLYSSIVIPRTGSFEPDKEYIEALQRNAGIWDDRRMQEAATAFAKLNTAQVAACNESGEPELHQVAFRHKALQPTVAAGWAFVAGMLREKPDRLSLLYRIPENIDRRTSKDPLNAIGMSRGRHHSDPPTYRGLGTRQNPSEGQKLAELFRLISDPANPNSITVELIKFAVVDYHKKKAAYDAEEARRTAKGVRQQIAPVRRGEADLPH